MDGTPRAARRRAGPESASLILAGVVAVEAVHGIIDRHGTRALRPYIANAVDRIRTLERAARDGHQIFGVFEDDLVAGACPAETNRRIASALRELPPDADVLYLEVCQEKCDSLRSSSHRPSLARASEPLCSAGMVFTARGARRVAALCTPVFAGFDDMMPELVLRHGLRAYLAVPGVLYQYCFWGSDASRSKNLALQATGRGQVHAIFASVCMGGDAHHISARATLLRPAQLLALAARDAPARAALARMLERRGACEADSDTCGYILLSHPAALCPGCPLPDGSTAVLLTACAGPEGGDVDLAAWGTAGGLEAPELARVDGRSACWGRVECPVALAVEDVDAVQVAGHASVLLLAPPSVDGPPLWPPPPSPA